MSEASVDDYETDDDLQRDLREYEANHHLIAAAPELLQVVKLAALTYEDRLSSLEEEREWHGDAETDDMIAHYTSLLNDAKAAIAKAA